MVVGSVRTSWVSGFRIDCRGVEVLDLDLLDILW